jgi:hypothetical protein
MYGYGYSPFINSINTSGGTPVDPDTQAFITAAAITDPTQQAAINTLVVDLKGYNIWSKLRACYPFVGGTNAQHAWNLKNTAQYKITWYGGVTSSSNGVTGNGTNGYGDTFLNNNVMGQNDVHISIYTPAIATVFGSVIGSWANLFGSNIYSKQNPSTQINTHGSRINFTPFTPGFILVKRPNSTQILIQRNNSITTHSLAFNSYITTSFKLLRTGDYNGEYTNENLRFSSIGDSLTDTESTNLYNAVQAFQTTLGRQV